MSKDFGGTGVSDTGMHLAQRLVYKSVLIRSIRIVRSPIMLLGTVPKAKNRIVYPWAFGIIKDLPTVSYFVSGRSPYTAHLRDTKYQIRNTRQRSKQASKPGTNPTIKTQRSSGIKVSPSKGIDIISKAVLFIQDIVRTCEYLQSGFFTIQQGPA